MTDDAGTDVARATKSRLRSLVRARVAAMPATQRAHADRVICGNLSSLPEEVGASFVLAYLALPDEVRVDAFLAAMVERGRRTLVPRARGGRLRYARWQPCSGLCRDEEGVLAPEGGSLDELPAGVGLVVVPGRAFDACGRRLGRGGGYYDRLLSEIEGRHLVVGAAYGCQIVEEVPHEDHDRDVEYLVTETGCRRRCPPAAA